MSSAAERWAEYAVSLRMSDIPIPVIHQIKRHVLDTLACALGGYGNSAEKAIRSAAASDMTGPEEATVIGSGFRSSALNAILLNGAMVRFLDANDTTVAGHDSEVIPAVLAVAEREGSSGAEILTSIVLGYELAARFALAIQASSEAAVASKELERRGWNPDSRAGYVMPAVFGRLLRLDQEQIANAIGISGSRSPLLGIVDAAKEQNTLSKNIRFPFSAYMALISTYLAGNGMTGPHRVFEGHMGFNETIMSGRMDLQRLSTFGDEWFTLLAGTKSFSACYATHGHLQATIEIVHDMGLEAEQVAAIRIITNSRTLNHTGDATTRRRVFNKETADHSSYYTTAIALLYQKVEPEHYRPELYDDPKVLRLMDMISIEAEDETYKDVYPGARVEILNKDGQTFVREVKHPRGHHLNPMTDAEIESKFRGMADGMMSSSQQDEVIESVYSLDTADNPRRLMASLVFSAEARPTATSSVSGSSQVRRA